MAPQTLPAQRQRRTPQRTCVGCRTTTARRELVRVVRTPEQAVVVDPTGRRNGRGAYIHADPACWKRALSRDTLGRVLRAALRPEDRAALEAYAASLPPPDAAAP